MIRIHGTAKGKLHTVNHKSQYKGRVNPALPFFTPAANYNNRTDVLHSVLYVLLVFNEEVYIGILKTLYKGAQSLRTGVLRCGFVEI